MGAARLLESGPAERAATPRTVRGSTGTGPGGLAGSRWRRRSRSGRPPGQRWGGLYLLTEIGVAALAISLYLNSVWASPGSPRPGSTVLVTLGPPVVGTVGCGNSSSLHTEVVAWENASRNVSTNGIYVKVVELVDGDYVGGPDPPATVTPTNLCAGDAPSATFDWYLVVRAPDAGPYLAVFSFVDGWTGVGNRPAAIPIANGSSLTLVSVRSYATGGYGLAIEGAAGGPVVQGAVTL